MPAARWDDASPRIQSLASSATRLWKFEAWRSEGPNAGAQPCRPWARVGCSTSSATWNRQIRTVAIEVTVPSHDFREGCMVRVPRRRILRTEDHENDGLVVR